MSVTVRLATPLRAAAGGNATLSIEAADLATLTREITNQYPELAARVGALLARGRMATRFASASTPFVLNGALYSLPYDVLNDFQAISPLVTGPIVLVGRKTMPAKSVPMPTRA